MDGFVVHELAADVQVRVTRDMPELAAPLEQEIERLWQSACQRMAAGGAGELFNGRVFSADRITTHAITGHLTEFRRIVAQMEQPALFEALQVRPLAVCGVLCCRDGVVVGQRHPGSIYQAGLWQLPPAGSVDAHAVDADGRVDLGRQILDELQEELGLPPDSVGMPRPLCVVEHPGSHVSDLGMAMSTELDAQAVLRAHASSGNREYGAIRVVPANEIAAFVQSAGETLVPPAREFLFRVGWLKAGLS